MCIFSSLFQIHAQRNVAVHDMALLQGTSTLTILYVNEWGRLSRVSVNDELIYGISIEPPIDSSIMRVRVWGSTIALGYSTRVRTGYAIISFGDFDPDFNLIRMRRRQFIEFEGEIHDMTMADANHVIVIKVRKCS